MNEITKCMFQDNIYNYLYLDVCHMSKAHGCYWRRAMLQAQSPIVTDAGAHAMTDMQISTLKLKSQ